MIAINSSYKIYESKWDYISAFSVGLIALILYKHFKLDLYHFYIYFFIAGIISAYSSLMGWGEISNDGLSVRFGVLKSKKLLLRWEDIINIKTMYVKKKFSIKFGPGVTIPTKDTVKIKAIGIEMNEQFFSEYQTNYIRKLSRNMVYGQKIEIKENVIILYRRPPCGYKTFFSEIKKYIDY